MIRTAALFIALSAAVCAAPANPARDSQPDARLKKSFRKPQQNGWTYVHLEGSPADIGFQHGYLLASEIDDTFKVISLGLTHDSKKDWAFFSKTAEEVLWPHVEPEYQEEMRGIVQGLAAKGVKLELWDIVALNAWLELSPYYTNWYDKHHDVASTPSAAPEHCSAFVATGSYTKDGKPVIAHNNWTEYKEGSRWNIIFDIVPTAGHHILMDGMPGLIHSGDDFGVNDAGIAITETTIGYFSGYDPDAVPEFVRARKAMQYATSIDEFAALMKDGNNGGYANTWLIADNRNNEVGKLELGLKNVTLEKTKDGYFVGSNFPENPKLIEQEAPEYPVNDLSISANARHVRWNALMAEYKGKIDVAAAQRFLGDHYDTFDKKQEPDERTLCGHIDLSPRGSKPWQPQHGPCGTVQNKVADSKLIASMSFTAAMGHSCGINFRAADHLKKYPEFKWEQSILRDLNSGAWTTFRAE
ncbi:MAG: C45 family peptidase [Bryobacteraceae bacterium]|jgi:hypothetical protein